MTTDEPTPDSLDTWLTSGYDAFVADLTTTLDFAAGASEAVSLSSHFTDLTTDLIGTLGLAAGAGEATYPQHYAALADDLRVQLDVSAGLAAILGRSAPTQDTPVDRPSPPSDEPSLPQDWTIRLIGVLSVLKPPTRLSLRTNPAYQAFHRSIRLTTHVNALRCQADALARDLDLARLDLARDLAGDLARLDRDLARLNRARLDRDLARDLDLARARDLARALARDLDLARLEVARAHDVDRSLALDLARAVSRDLARALARLELVVDRALDLARALSRDLDLDLDVDVDASAAGASSELLECLDEVTVDFVGADLHAVSLVGVPLEGIRWSDTTRWPPDWEDEIRARSVRHPLEPGIYTILYRGHHDRTPAHTRA